MSAVTDEAISAVTQRHQDALDQLDRVFARTNETARQLLSRLDSHEEPDDRPPA